MRTTILFNGTIYTQDQRTPRAEALAIRAGRVLAIGSEREVRAAAGPGAEALDLGGRAAVPALTDAHVHLLWYALGRRQVRLEDVPSIDEAVRLVAAAVPGTPEGAWLQGSGWNHALWGEWPTAAALNRVAPNVPVFLIRKDGHSAWANSRALALAGIDDSTPDPFGGEIMRENGKATGVLLENAIDLVRSCIPTPGDAERHAAIRDAIREAHSFGMVGMHIPPALLPDDGALILSDLQRLREMDQLALRSLVHLDYSKLDAHIDAGIRSGLGDRWLRLGAVKMFADGSLGSESAEMLEPYEGRTGTGIATMSTDELNDAVERCMANGLAVIIHAIGDAANRRVLDAVERAQERTSGNSRAHRAGRSPIPNRMEHAQIVHPSDMPRFAQLGVIASVQPIHATADYLVADRLWGKRSVNAYAWRSLMNAGATLAFGSDAPVESLNPWYGIHAAVTRSRRDGSPAGGWYPEQCLTVAEALWGFTAGSAMVGGCAHEQGTLAPGMLADIAVLSDDPFTCAPQDLHRIGATTTLLEGDVVWEAS